MKNKFLVTINRIEDINELKELGITRFVYPLDEFCVGIPNTFLLSEIKEDGYLLINRILDNEGIDKLKDVLKSIPKNIKGIIFDDLGVYEIIKDYNLEKILYLSHFNNNSESVNLFLNLVDTIILSTDITKEEIEYIISKSKKKISLFYFGYVKVMYSRRLLIDNYVEFHKLKRENPLQVTSDEANFLVYENDFGTIFYHDKPLYDNTLLDLDTKYLFINSSFINIEDIKKVIKNDNPDILCDQGFLYKETIYKLKGE